MSATVQYTFGRWFLWIIKKLCLKNS